MAKVVLRGFIVVLDTDLEHVKNELVNHIKLTKQEQGCLCFEVTQDEHDKNIFHVYEEFSSQEAFNFHQKRVQESSWGKATTNVQRHYEISES